MRESLEKLLSSAIVFEYDLPHGSTPKVTVSNAKDDCYRNATNSDDIKELIYNGLIDYGIEESGIDLSRLPQLHKLVLQSKIRYEKNDTLDNKIKYGFFGEVLLHLIIGYFYKTSTLVSRGYFYNPLERSETKGYDTFQIRNDSKGNPELWFAEVKFYGEYKQALTKIFDNVDKALSDDYLSSHFRAFVNFYDKMLPGSKATQIVDAFINDPDVNIMQQIQQNQMTLVYPALLICDDKNLAYDDIIKEIVDYINKKYTYINVGNLTIPYRFFFAILPVKDSKTIKTDVIQWISLNHPLI